MLKRALLAAMLMAAAGVSAVSSEPAAGASASTVVVARHLNINSLDPHRAFCESCRIFNSNVYETLVAINEDNQLTPLLARSWSSNADQTEFTFSLATDARFADGTPVEAKDVKWSFERLKNLEGHASFLMSAVTSIEMPDPHTVLIRTSSPFSEFLNLAASPYMAIVNSDLAITKGASGGPDAPRTDRAEAWFQQNSAGSGPYRLVSYSSGVELRLERNENYWRRAPAMQRVVFREAKDPAAQAKMIEEGSADLAMELSVAAAEKLASKGVTVEYVPSDTIIYLALSPGAKSSDVALNHTVRAAFAHALDRRNLIETVLKGRGQAIAAPIPPRYPGGNGHAVPEPDLEKARALLKEAGLESGFSLEAVFPDLNVYGVDLAKLMEAVRSSMGEIGINIALNPVSFATWRERINGEGIPLTAVFYGPDYFGSAQFAEYFGMIEGSVWARWAGATMPLEPNKRAAELYAQALASSPRQARAIWHALGEEMTRDLIIFPIVSPNRVLAYRSEISGVGYSTCCILRLAGLSR